MKKHLLSLVILVFGSFNLLSQIQTPTWPQGQTDFITVVSLEGISLTAEEQQKISLVSTKYGAHNIHAVRITDISLAQSKGRLALQLPSIECTPLFTVCDIQCVSSDDYTWFGNVEQRFEPKKGGTAFEKAQISPSCWDGFATL